MPASLILACVGLGIAGMLASAVASLIPGLHIYNVIAITMTVMFAVEKIFHGLDPMLLTSFVIGLVVGFSFLFTISSQFFQPCDDSYRYIMLPHEKFLFEGRGHEAVILGSIGSLVAVLFIGLGIPLAGMYVAELRDILRPHTYWILGAVIVFLLMTEWPKDPGTGPTPVKRLLDGWIPILMGYVCFGLAGLLGIFVMSRTILPVDGAFQSLMPVFVGLFAIPSQIGTLINLVDWPRQHACKSVEVGAEDVIRGSASGLLAGLFCSFVPAVTPGPALLLSGHATVTGGDRQFIIGGGAGRVMYYVGILLFFFMPGTYFRRGGAAINISLFFEPETQAQFLTISGLIAIVGVLSFLLVFGYSRFVQWIASKIDYRWLSLGGMAVMVALVAWITGWQGVVIMLVASAIGFIPMFWHTRRIGLLAVILVPLFLNMAGIGQEVAAWFGFVPEVLP
jgi:putative membrane protein